MQVCQLLSAVGTTGDGKAFRIDPFRFRHGNIPVVVHESTPGSPFTGTVVLKGAIATDSEVRNGEARFEAIENLSWTENGCKILTAPFTHIRGCVTDHTANSISMRAYL